MAPSKQQTKGKRQPQAAKKRSPRRDGPSQATGGYTILRGNSSGITVRGKEILGTVDATAPGPNIAAVFDCNPACWTNSRLALLARTYEKYKFTRATVRYIPSVSAATNGVAALYVETDPDERLVTGAASLQTISNMQFSRMGPVSQVLAVPFNVANEDKSVYFCSVAGSSERRDTSQFIIACNVGNMTWPTGVAAQGVGYVEIEYELQLLYQELEIGAPGIQYSPENVTIAAAAAAEASTVTFQTSSLSTAKVLEIRFRDSVSDGSANSDAMFFGTSGTGNQITILPGMPIYAANSGGKWQLYHSYVAARVLAPALAWVVARAGKNVSAFVRPMIERGDSY